MELRLPSDNGHRRARWRAQCYYKTLYRDNKGHDNKGRNNTKDGVPTRTVVVHRDFREFSEIVIISIFFHRLKKRTNDDNGRIALNGFFRFGHGSQDVGQWRLTPDLSRAAQAITLITQHVHVTAVENKFTVNTAHLRRVPATYLLREDYVRGVNRVM